MGCVLFSSWFVIVPTNIPTINLMSASKIEFVMIPLAYVGGVRIEERIYS